ncbi:MAG TPA: MarR family transcriptional regulator [Symbiobacteriaceae bacterium]|nr:MarR family transcriptional regulator [Symbiobacteriaceae bacterium]
MERQTEQLVDLMQTVHRLMYEHVRCVWEERETPATQMMVMHQIARAEGITVSEASRRLGLAKSHVSKTVDELATAGYVEKRPDPHDGRVLRLYRTPAAVARFDKMQAVLRERISAVVGTLPPAKAAGLIEGLHLLSGALEAARAQEKTCK